jgi:methyl-accepting chemotaxis protein
MKRLKRFLYRLKLRQKILGGFGLILLLLAISSIVSNVMIVQINGNVDQIINRETKQMIDATNLNLRVTQVNSNLRGYLLTADDEQIQLAKQRLADVGELKNRVLAAVSDGEVKEKLNQLDQWSALISEQLMPAIEARNHDVATAILSHQVVPVARVVQEGLDAHLNQKQENVVRLGAQAVQKGHQTLMTNSIVSVAAIVLGILIAFFLTNPIVKPILQLGALVRQVASGDLRVDKVEVKSQDEVGKLVQDFNFMAENLKRLVEQLSLHAEQVAASSQQLSATAEETTQAAQQIATTIQEVASGAEMGRRGVEESSRALEELAAGIQRVAESSSVAYDVSEKAAEEANEGNRAIQEAVTQITAIDSTMSHLSEVVRMLDERSQEIGKIVQVITDISSQTNLLALNASIEAARAGEQGRGFAVVANEIRSLAEQTRVSAEEIIRLIEEIQRNTEQTVKATTDGAEAVRAGTVAVSEAGKAFERILEAARNVVMQVQETSAAAEEMSASTEEMTSMFEEVARSAKESLSGASTVSTATEEQLASMEEVTASADSLSRMAEELQQLVRQFKI